MLIKEFEDYANSHYQLNDFGYGQTADISSTRQMKFPYMWTTHSQSSTIDIEENNILDLSFSFLIMDQINIQENYKNDNGFQSNNQAEIISDTLEIAQDFVVFLTSGDFSKRGVTVNTNNGVNLTNVYDDTTDKATGWMLDVSIKIMNINCLTPINIINQ